MRLSMEEKPSTRANDEQSTSVQIIPAVDSPLQNLEEEKSSRFLKAWRRIRSSKIYGVLSWTPPKCRWDPEKPPQFSMSLNILFAFAGAFTVANLYYSHPILNILAHDFNVSYEAISRVPTLAQAGYAVGLLFLCPLGDVVKRRPFTLLLIFFTAAMWIGLCVTKSLAVFSAITFITAVTTVTPQIMLPLVGDLAPIHRRAASLSIVVAGLTLGILVARVLSGAVANYTSWRNIYWLSCGLQFVIFILLWLFMPDYPSTNPGGLNYFKMMWSILVLFCRHAVLIQACIISFCTSATFTNFWTTLTFLLAGPPYHYAPLPIGLFGLIGIAGMAFAPVYGRLVTDRFHPWLSVMVGELMVLLAVCVGTYTGTFSVAGPIIQAIFHDAGMQTAQVANRSSIYSIAPKARNRVNTAFMLATFCGQLTGTAVGNHVYAQGGWIRSGSVSVGFCGGAILILCMRGPWEEGRIGWHGGCSFRKVDKNTADGKNKEQDLEASGRRGTQDIKEALKEPDDLEKVVNEMAAEEQGDDEVNEKKHR